jgi:hypothetical protein
MVKHRGNPNLGKPDYGLPVVVTSTSFEQAVKELGLAPELDLAI